MTAEEQQLAQLRRELDGLRGELDEFRRYADLVAARVLFTLNGIAHGVAGNSYAIVRASDRYPVSGSKERGEWDKAAKEYAQADKIIEKLRECSDEPDDA